MNDAAALPLEAGRNAGSGEASRCGFARNAPRALGLLSETGQTHCHRMVIGWNEGDARGGDLRVTVGDVAA